MSRVLALAMALAALCHGAHAEVFVGARKGLALGFHYMSEDEDGPSSLMPGFTGGIVAGMPVSGPVGSRIELLISEKGRRNKQEDVDIRIATLEVPVLARVEVPLGPRWLVIAVMTGPVFSYRISGSVRSDEATSTIDGQDLQRLDVGAAMAIEAGARIRAYTVSLEVRFEAGFLPVFDLAGDDSRECLLSVGLGYGVHLPSGGD